MTKVRDSDSVGEGEVREDCHDFKISKFQNLSHKMTANCENMLVAFL